MRSAPPRHDAHLRIKLALWRRAAMAAKADHQSMTAFVETALEAALDERDVQKPRSNVRKVKR